MADLSARLVRRVPKHPEPIVLGAAIVPTVVMVVRAITSGWMPLFDAAYFTVRSRDVFTTNSPLVGAWSMGSREIGVWVNNLGPLQLDLLAPFTKLDPYWGTAVGVGLTNIAAIVGVWFVSRRMFGPIGVVGAMAATVLLQLNEGSLMLIEARQQLALVLPMWCLLWLAAATWRGDRWTTPWLAFASSLVMQTHFTYAYQTIAVTIGAVISLVVRHRATPRDLLRPALVCLGVAAVCWAQPVWDQLLGTGNMTKVLDQSGGSSRSVGASKGLRILAETAFVPPFFSPGSMGDLLREGPRVSLPIALIALACWALLLIAVVVFMRIRTPALAAMGAVSLVALASSSYAVTKIPPTEQFGIIAQNYYWVWPVVIFLGTAIIGAALRALMFQLRDAVVRPDGLAFGVTALVVLGIVPLLAPTDLLPETDHEWNVSRLQARPLMDQFGDSLDDIDFDGPVLVDLGSVRHVRYTMLTELQARGIDFRFGAGATDLSRFGRERCDDGSAAYFITLRGGPSAVLVNSRDTLLASVPGLTRAQAQRSTELATQFGNEIRGGRITVNDEGVEYLGGDVPQALVQVRDTPGASARHLSAFLSDWYNFDQVVVPDDWLDDLHEWRELEDGAANNRMAIYLSRISPHRQDLCAALEPGAGFVPPA